jgi:hypothetical protein
VYPGERDRPRRAAADVDLVPVDPHVLDPRTLGGVVRARPQGLQERVRIEPLRPDLDPRPEAIPAVVPVRIVADGDVEPVAPGEERVRRVASFGLIRPAVRGVDVVGLDRMQVGDRKPIEVEGSS